MGAFFKLGFNQHRPAVATLFPGAAKLLSSRRPLSGSPSEWRRSGQIYPRVLSAVPDPVLVGDPLVSRNGPCRVYGIRVHCKGEKLSQLLEMA